MNICEGIETPIIRFRGVFDWLELYRVIKNWIASERFTPQEKKYKHKGDEVEVEVWGDKKIDTMFKHRVDVAIHVWDLKTVEIMENGVSKKANTGKLEIVFTGKVEVDYNNTFSGGKMAEQLGKWYFAIMKNDIKKNQAGTLESDIYRLHLKVKKFLKMESDSNAQ